MPGIDKSRIINVSESDDDLVCIICLAIFVEPVVIQCKCQQIYCKECINHWLNNNISCPNCRGIVIDKNATIAPRLATNLLNKLIFSCDYAGNGCEEKLSYSQYNQHIRECLCDPQAICADCGHKKGLIREHNCVNNLAKLYPCLQTKIESLDTKIETITAEKERIEMNLEKQINENESLKRDNEILAEIVNKFIKLEKTFLNLHIFE